MEMQNHFRIRSVATEALVCWKVLLSSYGDTDCSLSIFARVASGAADQLTILLVEENL